jgi:hypothetical protein
MRAAIEENALEARSRMQTELWISYGGFIVAWFCFFFVIQMMNPVRRNVSSLVFVALAAAAVYAITVGFVMRKKLFALSAKTLPANPQKALGQWRAANIIGFSCAMNPAILGVVLKFLGASWSVPGIFFCRKLSLSYAVETALGPSAFLSTGLSEIHFYDLRVYQALGRVSW